MTLAPADYLEDLSEKNPLEILPEMATLVELLRLFATGTHRGTSRFDLL